MCKTYNIVVNDWTNSSPLFWACSQGHLSTVKWLCKHHYTTIDSFEKANIIMRFVETAFSYNHFRVVKFLMKYYDIPFDSIHESLVGVVSREGNLTVLKWLCKRCKPTVHTIKTGRNRAFRWACANGRTKIVKYLLKHYRYSKSDIRRCNNFALKWAASNNHYNVVKTILKHLQPIYTTSHLNCNVYFRHHISLRMKKFLIAQTTKHKALSAQLNFCEPMYYNTRLVCLLH